MSEQDMKRLVRAFVELRGTIHPVLWKRTPEMAAVRRQLMADLDQARAAERELAGG